MKNLSRLVCFLWLSVSALAVQPPSTVPDLLAEADTMYWFAQAEGGDMKMLGQGLEALDRADALLAVAPADADRDKLMAASAALRTELTEQMVMAHDTVNGTLPLFRYFIFRDAVSEWVDDPMVITAVRGAKAVSATASTHWKPYPQLDVVYGSEGWDRSSETPQKINSPTQENEMAYVFNLDGRFFNHHRGEISAALGSAAAQVYETQGLDAGMAQELCRQWGIDRLLEVRIRELFIDQPWWFYVVTGRLFSASDGASEATVNSFGMVRDQTAKTPWLVLVFLPAALAALWAAVFCHRAWPQALVAAFVSFVASATFVVAVGRWIPPGDYLLSISWWAPAAVALTLLCVLPLVVYTVSWRFSAVAAWFFGSSARTAASAVGLGAGVGGLASFAALTALDPAQAAVLAILSVPAFGSIPARLFALLRTGKSETQLVDALPALAALAFFAWVFWVIPSEDRSASSLMIAALPAALALAVLAGLLFTRVASFAGLAVFSLGAFGAMMTGQAVQLSLFALVGVGLVALKDKTASLTSLRRLKTAAPPKGGWSEIFANCSENWPLARVAPLARVEEVLAEASGKAAEGKVSIVEVYGGAGTGKTRMVGEAIAARGWRLYHGTCRAGQPFAFLQEAVQRSGAGGLALLSGGQESNVAVDIGAKLVSSVPVLGTLCDWIAPTGYDQENITPENLASEFLSMVQAAGRPGQEPPVLWIDEAEHLDEDGRALVRALDANARTRHQSLLIVLSGRRANGDVGAGHQVSLHWNEEDNYAALRDVLKDESAKALVAANPGLVAGSYVLWVQHLWHRGSLEEQHGKLGIKDDDKSCFEVPHSVVAAAGKSLEGVDTDVVEALRAAAVDGTSFHVTAVAQAAEMPTLELLRRLERAEEWGIVKDMPDDEVFAFRNVPLREYLVASLGHSSEQKFRQRYYRLNRGLADAYAGFGDARFLPEAALHAREAGDNYAAKAVSLCLKAAQFCQSRGQWQKAAEHAVFAMERGSAQQSAEAGIVYLRANWLIRRNPADGDISKHLASLRSCLANELNADTKVLLACELVRILWPSPWNPSGADPSAPQLLDGLAPESSAAKIRALHFRGASLHKFAGKEDTEARRKALALLREATALPAADRDARQERAEALNTLAEVAMHIGEWADVEPALAESIAIKRSMGDRQGLAISYGALGRFHFHRKNRTSEDLGKAIEAYEEDLRISIEIGDASGIVAMPSFIALCHLEGGDPAKALELYRQSASAAKELGQKRNEAFARCGIVRCLAALCSPQAQEEADTLAAMVARLGTHDRSALAFGVQKVGEACAGTGIKFAP
jgi:tetratricopeptide (TPR) repeat protein